MNAIRRYRERTLLTQRALAAALGVTVSTVARWETLPDDKLPLRARQFLELSRGAILTWPAQHA